MFQEIGTEGRLGAFRDGIKAFVIYKGQREDGRHDYSLGRISEYINFNLHLIIDELNQREGLVGSSDHWGCDGSGIIGGSPRGVGSGVAPEELIEIINAICEYSQQQSGLFVPQM